MSSLMTRSRSRRACAMPPAQVVRSATLIPGFSPPKRGPRFRPTGTPLQRRQFREVRLYPIPPVCLLQRQPEAPANEQDGHYQACRQHRRMSRVSAHPLGSALRKAGRPRRDGLISLEPLEIFRQSGSRWRTAAADLCAGTSGRSSPGRAALSGSTARAAPAPQRSPAAPFPRPSRLGTAAFR